MPNLRRRNAVSSSTGSPSDSAAAVPAYSLSCFLAELSQHVHQVRHQIQGLGDLLPLTVAQRVVDLPGHRPSGRYQSGIRVGDGQRLERRLIAGGDALMIARLVQ